MTNFRGQRTNMKGQMSKVNELKPNVKGQTLRGQSSKGRSWRLNLKGQR